MIYNLQLGFHIGNKVIYIYIHPVLMNLDNTMLSEKSQTQKVTHILNIF